MLVSQDHIRQFNEEGFFVLEKIISPEDLSGLRAECQRNLDMQVADMDRVGAEVLGLSHKNERYFLPCNYEESQFLKEFLFGDTMMEIVRSVIGDDAFFFLELFLIKPPRTGTPFAWHQDSGYLLGNPHKPYLSIWCALDDVTEENGVLYALPYSRAGCRTVVAHTKDKKTNDLVGYHGSDPGIAIPVPAGSMVLMSSITFHRSGPNTTDKPRRAYLASYSPEPITYKDGKLWNHAVPFIKDGLRVTETCARQH